MNQHYGILYGDLACLHKDRYGETCRNYPKGHPEHSRAIFDGVYGICKVCQNTGIMPIPPVELEREEDMEDWF